MRHYSVKLPDSEKLQVFFFLTLWNTGWQMIVNPSGKWENTNNPKWIFMTGQEHFGGHLNKKEGGWLFNLEREQCFNLQSLEERSTCFML